VLRHLGPKRRRPASSTACLAPSLVGGRHDQSQQRHSHAWKNDALVCCNRLRFHEVRLQDCALSQTQPPTPARVPYLDLRAGGPRRATLPIAPQPRSAVGPRPPPTSRAPSRLPSFWGRARTWRWPPAGNRWQGRAAASAAAAVAGLAAQEAARAETRGLGVPRQRPALVAEAAPGRMEQAQRSWLATEMLMPISISFLRVYFGPDSTRPVKSGQTPQNESFIVLISAFCGGANLHGCFYMYLSLICRPPGFPAIVVILTGSGKASCNQRRAHEIQC
jgi:hypothetical protein